MAISTIFSSTNLFQTNQANVTSQSSTQVYDTKDTNKDGIVSSQEALEYDLKHPSKADNSQQILKSSDNDNSVGRNVNTTA